METDRPIGPTDTDLRPQEGESARAWSERVGAEYNRLAWDIRVTITEARSVIRQARAAITKGETQ